MEKNNRKTYALGYHRARLLEVLAKVESKKREWVKKKRVTDFDQWEAKNLDLSFLNVLMRTKRLKHLSYHDGELVIEATIG